MTTTPAASELLGARRITELFRRHGVRPKKSLGQNFVIDPNTIRKVVAVAGIAPSDDVLEIGAGAGSLTLGLAARARNVVAWEFDRALIPVLNDVLAGLDNVKVIAGDALRMDLAELSVDKLVGNLPYNIAATLVIRVLSQAPQIASLTVMTQLEVGRRLAAAPGDEDYGVSSVMVSAFGTARVAARVSRKAFFPEPNVDSVIVTIDRHERSDRVDPQEVFPVIKAAFAQRRKTLRNNLAEMAGSPRRAEDVLVAAGIDPSTRAEQVDLEGFIRIAEALQ
ncbi:MAG TPA: 16S rRNA (adenine(1518)-N(6)/adenine(1519)-N(6))-dimethyltransferase RsmA [Actinomycetota bacterium]|nr:16S rRNA (adenine(1518)-N(6)/adenine(1519)-N(6))-dimethyltransferase RsmA [Actinomycetota bacterium]